MKRRPVEPSIDKRGEFEPRLPTGIARRPKGILGRIKSLASMFDTPQRRGGGGRKGRGVVRNPPSFNQRVTVKGRVVRGATASKRAAVLRAHVSYLRRNGVAEGEGRAQFFSADAPLPRDIVIGMVNGWAEDQHSFRFIISPEGGAKLDLEEYTKRVIRAVEKDLGTTLQWFGACHYNTDNPHAHVVIRGVDERGMPLRMSKDYMSHGFRHVAEHEATLELGRRNPLDITAGVAKSIHALRVTPFDKEFLRLQAQSLAREVILPPLKGKSPEWMRQARTNKLRRLSVLVEWGLAREVRTGVWSVDPDLLEILSARAKRIEIEKRVTKHLGLSPARLQPLVIHDRQSVEPVNVYGLVVGSGLVSELGDAKFILVSGSDGATHYMPLGRFSESSGFECRVGDVVAVTTASRKSKSAEDVAFSFLGDKGGEFSLSAFQAHVSDRVSKGKWFLPEGVDVEGYVDAFRMRFETLEREGIVRALSIGTWEVPDNLLDKASALNNKAKRPPQLKVTTHSRVALSEQVFSPKAAWLDRLFNPKERALVSGGWFESETLKHLEARKEFLMEKGLYKGGDTFYSLLRRDESSLKASLTKRYGKELTLSPGQMQGGEVVGYELLGDGYRMIAATPNGYVVRRVEAGEQQLPWGTAIEITGRRSQRGSSARSSVRKKSADAGERARTFSRAKGAR